MDEGGKGGGEERDVEGVLKAPERDRSVPTLLCLICRAQKKASRTKIKSGEKKDSTEVPPEGIRQTLKD